MNADAHKPPQSAAETQAQVLLENATKGFRAFSDHVQPLRDALHVAETLGNIPTIKTSARLSRKLDQFKPSVTMIGQIKSGKTTLVNSLIGWPGLLPADVNPWTSVVTSLHLCPRALTPPTSARFRFFENSEWDKLISGGGRIGELAERAGADDELSKIKEQVIAMREKSKERLGRKFEILLGSEHNYGYFDQELVERYVCLGDDFEDDLTISKSQGRFADITKSADLSMHQPGYPINLCIRDTPGVNDTFMIREQITIKSIRDSRICVVVLSAHQALSATDLGLIRLITQVKSRDVLIFVNRIDELANPAVQVAEIRDSIRATLKQHKCPADAEIMFGSGLWAEHAITGGVQTLPYASQKALENWAEHKDVTGPETENELMWSLSGVPDLLGAISERVSEGEGHDILRAIASETGSLLASVKAADNLEAKAQVGEAKLSVSVDHLRHMLDEIAAAAEADLNESMDRMTRDFSQRLERAHITFLTRATDALAKHLEIYGVDTPWAYDPTGLRMMLNSAYTIFGTKCQGAFNRAAVAAGESYRALYHQALNLPQDLFDPRIPPAPRIPPPVSLGQTIALDLRGSWWSGWWNRRKSFHSQAARFHDLIAAETGALLNDLIQDQASVIQEDMRAQLNGYTMAQTGCFDSMLGIGDPDISRLFDVDSLKERDVALTQAIKQLDQYTDVSQL